MTMFKTMMAGGLGLAALAAAAPANAQYGYYNGYNGYNNGYASPYGNAYGYNGNRGDMTQVAASQCAAAVQSRLSNRVGIQGILGAVLGSNVAQGRVLTVSSATPSSTRIRVRGLASSGRYAYNNNGYGAYGYGAYGASGYGYANAADLSFRCDVDYNGRVRDIDINRR